MASSFTWLQFDAEQSRRARELVKALSEPMTLDSIGIGAIRDGFANLFFPGTSTIQTRARYFLLVPWAMQHVERRSPRTREQYDRWLKEAEVATINALADGSPDAAGIIGIERRERVQTLPSAIYWTGLGAWGVRTAAGLSRVDVRDHTLARRGTGQQNDGHEPFLLWDTVPPGPDRFPSEPLQILPTREEAEYLLAKMASTRLSDVSGVSGPTLLARVAQNPERAQVDHVWDLDDAILTDQLRDLVRLARGFALVVQGARLRYLDLLFERKAAVVGQDAPGRETLGELVEDWLTEMDDAGAFPQEWLRALPHLFATLTAHGVRLTDHTRDFVATWCTAAARDPRAAIRDASLADRIRERELLLKKSSARLTYDSPLHAWNGELLGSEPLDFRWGVAQRLILDCLEGMEATDAQR